MKTLAILLIGCFCLFQPSESLHDGSSPDKLGIPEMAMDSHNTNFKIPQGHEGIPFEPVLQIAANVSEDFPMHFLQAGFSYQVEYVSVDKPEVIFFEELYSPFQGSGRLVYHTNKESATFTYFEESDEIFLQKGGRCYTENLHGTTLFGIEKSDWIYWNIDGKLVLGPISIYYRAKDSSEASPLSYKGDGPLVRGELSKVWQQNIGPFAYKYYFGAQDLEPLRVDVIKENKLTLVLNFYAFDSGYDEHLTIPYEAGCNRTHLIEDGFPPIFDQDLFWQGEIVFVDHLHQTDDGPIQYILDFQTTFDALSQSYALLHESWRSMTNERALDLNPYRRVFTNATGVFYEINLNTRQCAYNLIENDDSLLYIELPDNSRLGLNDPEIIDSKGYIYMGSDMVDGFPVDVFEKQVEGYQSWNKAIITRMQYADQANNGLEHRSFTPYKIVIKIYNNIDKLAGEVILNTYTFLQRIPNKMRHFNIKDCEELLSPSKWFKMVFSPAEVYPLRGHQLMEEIMSRDSDAELEFAKTLISASKSELHPYRMAEVMLDYTCDNLNVYGKLLGRAPQLPLFTKKIIGRRIKNDQKMISTLNAEDCAKQCLDDSCGAFSYCDGGTVPGCTLSFDGKYTRIKNMDCTIYVLPDGLRKKEPSSDKLIQDFHNILNLDLTFEKKLSDNTTDVIVFKHNRDLIINDNDIEEFPDIRMLARKGSFQMISEINNRTVRKNGNTIQVTESYNFFEGFGKTVYSERGQTKEMYFSVETNELFTVKPDHCFTEPLNDSYPFGNENELFNEDLVYQDELVSLIGPSALLHSTYRRSIKEAASVYYEGPGEVIRGQSSRVWVDCSNQEVDYKYYFSKTKEDSELPRPLRITVQSNTPGRNKINLTYEIFNFHWEIDESAFRLPLGKGCERLDPNSGNFPPLPALSMDTDLFIRAEVVLDDKAAEKPTKIMSNFMMAKDARSMTSVYSTTNWTLTKDGTMLSEDTWRSIYGLNVETRIDETNGYCSMEQKDDIKALMSFPGGLTLSIDEHILLGGKDYSYMDQYTERSLQTLVYEKVLTDYNISSTKQYKKAIITRFFLDNQNKFADETSVPNPPLRTRLQLFNTDKDKHFVLDKVISFNFYELKTNIINKPKIFSIENCMVDEGSYSWFQVTYNLQDPTISKSLLEVKGSIGIAFMTKILKSLVLSPARMSPKVEVDITNDYLTISAKLLERTSPMYDYKELKGVKVADIAETHSTETKEECAQKCVESQQCLSWSFCGKTCSIAYNAGEKASKDSTCSTFVLNDLLFDKETQETTLVGGLKKLKYLAQEGKLTLSLPPLEDGSRITQLISSKFSSDIAVNETTIDIPMEDFPLYYFDMGYSYQVEYATTTGSEVVYFEELYSIYQKAGKLIYHKNNETATYTFFQDSKELFFQKGDLCYGQLLDTAQPFANLPNTPDWIYWNRDKDLVTLGPISVYYRADQYSDSNPIRFKGKGPLVRGRATKYWTQTISPYFYTFYFDAKDLEPIRIDIKKNDKPFEVLNFYDFDAGYDDPITIPYESGCNRTNPIKDGMPLMFDKDLFWQGELIYTNHIHKQADEPKQFIIDFQVAYDLRSNSYALNHESWRSKPGDAGKDVANLHPYKRVHTVDSGISYLINLNTLQCTIETTDSPLMYVQLPDNSYMYLNDPDIVGNEDFDYLGSDLVDNVAVDVFEKVVKPYEMGGKRVWSKAIITRMQYADQVNNRMEYKSFDPYKIVLKLFGNDDKLAREIVINVFTFLKNSLIHKAKHFSLEACEKELSPRNKWFKMVFAPAETYPIRGHALMEEIMSRDTDIELQFRNDLALNSELGPARLSEVLLDYTCDNLNIYGKVLGRAPAKLSFYGDPVKQTIVSFSLGEVADTDEECASFCLDAGCVAFSFCDGMCSMSRTTDEELKTENNTLCLLYKARYGLKPEPSTDSLIKSFAFIENMELMFIRNSTDNLPEVIAFKHNKDLSRNDFDVEEFPDLTFLSRKDSFQMTSEINNRASKNKGGTIQVTEFYSFEEGFGKTIYSEKGETKEMFFSVETNELFTVYPDRCTVQALNESVPFGEYEEDIFKQDMIYQEEIVALIGPSALLLRTYERSIRESSAVHYEGPGNDIRGQPSQVWVDCSDPDVDYKYYFTRPIEESETPLPLRITVESMGKTDNPVNQTYEIFNFHWQVDETILKLPHGKGCERLDKTSKAFPPFPSLPSDYDLFIRGEVVFDDRATDTPKKVMSNFMMASDSIGSLTAYTTTNWTLDKNDVFKATDTFRHVYGINVETTIDETNGVCYTLQAEDMMAVIQFPGGFSLKVDENILFGGEGYSYIDEYVERDLKAVVYERVLTDYKVNSELTYPKAIITRFFLSNENKFAGEKNLANPPLRTHLKLYRTEKNEKFALDKVVSFNFYEFKTEIIHKPKIFTLEDCRLDQGSYTWFQVLYPYVDKEESKSILEEEGSIADTFVLDLLNTLIITSARLSPDVEVDTTNEHLVITAKLLERTSPMYDYIEQKDSKVAQIDETDMALTKEECAKKCLDSGICRSWSHCGMVCYISHKSGMKKIPAKDSGCSTYILDEQLFPVNGGQELSLEKALEKIKELAVKGKLTIALPPLYDGTKVPAFKSSGFGTDIPENKNNLGDDHFSIAQKGKKYDAKNLVGVYFMGDISHQKCFQYCDAMDACLSLSVCALDSSCSMYAKHPSEVDSKYFLPSTECAVFEKKYSSSYNLFPGYVGAGDSQKTLENQTLEQCAASCSKESSFACLSFDHCGVKSTCRLFEDHVTRENADKKLKAGSCNHYSRKFLYDFETIRNKKAEEEQLVFQDVNLESCAKSCLENSGMVCRSFDYCPKLNGKGKCILTSRSESNAGLIPSTGCDHHYRKKELPRAQQHYSQGAAGGIGFVFIVLGIILGIAGVFTYHAYVRRRRS